MSIQHLKKIGLGAFIVFGVASCYPGGPEYIEDYDATYIHQVDLDYDWEDKSKTVYFMPDTVVDISDPDNSPSSIGNPEYILNEVEKNMSAFGFTRETDSTNIYSSDFIVLVSTIRSNNYYYTWWGGWDYWWGWGGCCYYPPYTTVSNYRTGSVTLDIIDVNQLDTANHEIPIIWQGVADGLYEGSSSNIKNRVTKSVDKMFELSPYLNRN